MIYAIAYAIMHILVRPLFRIRWIGRENVPARGPVILAGNHASYLDPLVIAAGMRRKLSFMAKSELFEVPVLAWISRGLTAFPVRRGMADREAIQTATNRLSEGGALGIFPEGTRNPDGGGVAQEGAAFLAMRSGAPIVPVGIDGTARVRPAGVRLLRFPAITIVYGAPIDPAAFEGGRRERISAMTEELMRRIDEAREQARRRK